MEGHTLKEIEHLGEGRETKKLILTARNLEEWLRSKSCQDFLKWLEALSEAVHAKTNDVQVQESVAVTGLVEMLKEMTRWIDEIPPIAQPMRYGNKAYRTWHKRVLDEAGSLVKKHLQHCSVSDVAAQELSEYLTESIGNFTRIDYGTGHELAFVAMLYAAERGGFLVEADRAAVVLRVFNEYLTMMRKVQLTYMLEPAGSHGVWSLDDYQFLPFYFGASQLRGQTQILPSTVRNRTAVEEMQSKYLYFAAIAFILKVKSGPFSEHSPILNDISGIPTWDKIHSGMLKMFRAEVIGKFPVMQHFRFGFLFSWSDRGQNAHAHAAEGGNATPSVAVAGATAPTAAHPRVAGVSDVMNQN